jgi:hypothetical protein
MGTSMGLDLPSTAVGVGYSRSIRAAGFHPRNSDPLGHGLPTALPLTGP